MIQLLKSNQTDVKARVYVQTRARSNHYLEELNLFHAVQSRLGIHHFKNLNFLQSHCPTVDVACGTINHGKLAFPYLFLNVKVLQFAIDWIWGRQLGEFGSRSCGSCGGHSFCWHRSNVGPSIFRQLVGRGTIIPSEKERRTGKVCWAIQCIFVDSGNVSNICWCSITPANEKCTFSPVHSSMPIVRRKLGGNVVIIAGKLAKNQL